MNHKIFFSILFYLFIGSSIFGHSHHDHSTTVLRKWVLLSPEKTVEASFLLNKDSEIYLEKVDHTVEHFPFTSFCKEDQSYLLQRINSIQNLNAEYQNQTNSKLRILFFIALLVMIGLFFNFYRYFSHRWAMVTSILVIFLGLMAFKYKTLFGTDPNVIDEAFKPFKPKINTFWDQNYFYVESNGIPDHTMMKGITSWQQQVPIPQCYVGTNSWQIPLNPEPSSNPIPVDSQHFLRGAIALASNGIPIFNPYTNTGIDALVDGQLDIYGGHSGRADDYHYHIAPLHLHTLNQTKKTLPIAYGLDGYAVYGSVEPDGSPMKALDINHGHIGTDGTYHYHGTSEKPYMIARMYGKVTESIDKELVPQPRSKGVRPALTPLNGATITDCVPNPNGNGYNLSYKLNNQNYSVDYSWTNEGKFTYNFISPNGTNTQYYTGSPLCKITTSTLDKSNEAEFKISFQSSKNSIVLELNQKIVPKDIKSIELFDIQGNLLLRYNKFVESIDVSNLKTGVFLVSIRSIDKSWSRKVFVK